MFAADLLAVSSVGEELACRVVVEAIEPHRRYRLTATPDGNDSVTGDASDVFEALCDARRALEQCGLLLCCAGARRDVWPSGMQRDMGQGLIAYVLTLPRRAERPATVKIFDPVPPELAATVTEQQRFFEQWSASRLET